VQQQPSFLDISWSVPQCLNYCSDYFHLMIWLRGLPQAGPSVGPPARPAPPGVDLDVAWGQVGKHHAE
jgi:hypothetical protein